MKILITIDNGFILYADKNFTINLLSIFGEVVIPVLIYQN